VTSLLPIDGAQGEGGGQILRAALALSAATGQGFTMTRIRAGRVRPGLRPQHVASIRAAALVCGAKVGGVFEGSPDLRFEPSTLSPGQFRFEIGTAGATSLVAQTVLPPLATCDRPSRVEIVGGTHVPASPSFEFLSRHWVSGVEPLGLEVGCVLAKAGFFPPGGGEIRCEARPWTARPAALRLEKRGALRGVRGVSGASRVKGNIAERQREGAQVRLWEARRIETEWEMVSPPAASPGAFLFLEAVFEGGRGAFGALGERHIRPEALGDATARRLLAFLDGEAAVDPHLADQMAVPLALARGGGFVTTPEVTRHLETVASVLELFGIPARVFGRRGGPGGLEVDRC
jgi:RNA 3'-terminal phosphate cyclase (ATP)